MASNQTQKLLQTYMGGQIKYKKFKKLHKGADVVIYDATNPTAGVFRPDGAPEMDEAALRKVYESLPNARLVLQAHADAYFNEPPVPVHDAAVNRGLLVDVLVAARCTPNPWTYEDYPGLRRSGTKQKRDRKFRAAAARSHDEVQKKYQKSREEDDVTLPPPGQAPTPIDEVNEATKQLRMKRKMTDAAAAECGDDGWSLTNPKRRKFLHDFMHPKWTRVAPVRCRICKRFVGDDGGRVACEHDHAKGISRGSSSGHFCNGGVLAMVDFARRAGATAMERRGLLL